MKKKLYHQFACSSLILPEHRARLARHRRELARESSPGLLTAADEQQLEQFQRLAEQSICSGLPVKVTLIDGGSSRTVTGVLPEQQPEPGRLRLLSEKRLLSIPFAAIVCFEAMDGLPSPAH